jgi:hypothetical protein
MSGSNITERESGLAVSLTKSKQQKRMTPQQKNIMASSQG